MSPARFERELELYSIVDTHSADYYERLAAVELYACFFLQPGPR
jgi:hypothetical protein